jgi:hypothetical protein
MSTATSVLDFPLPEGERLSNIGSRVRIQGKIFSDQDLQVDALGIQHAKTLNSSRSFVEEFCQPLCRPVWQRTEPLFNLAPKNHQLAFLTAFLAPLFVLASEHLVVQNIVKNRQSF